MPTELQIEAAAHAIENLTRIGRAMSLDHNESRECARAALMAAERAGYEKRIGDAINDALYETPYDGKKNIPCLSPEQRVAAARAAIAAIAKN